MIRINDRAPVGQTLVSAAVFDDVLSLILLAWMPGLLATGGSMGFAELLYLLAEIAAFLVITFVAGVYVFPLGGRFMRFVKSQEIEVSAALVNS